MTTVEDVRAALEDTDVKVLDQKPVQNATQLHLSNHAKVNVYDTGTLVVQGKKPIKEATETLLSERLGAAVGAAPSNHVFVVYGRNDSAKSEVEAMLRRWGLEPVLLDQIPAAGLTLIEKLEAYTKDARFAVVLATGDDVATADDGTTQEYRARQNVVLELGMLLAKLGRPSVAILLENKIGMKKPSDIEGLEYIPFNDSVKEAGVALGKMMSNRGYGIDIKKL